MSAVTAMPPVPLDLSDGEAVHAYMVATMPAAYPEQCEVVPADWPYDCQAKRDNPRHLVWRCASHGVWWHSPR